MLLLERDIIYTHDDFEPYYSISVGFDDDKSLLIVKEKTDLEGKESKEVIIIDPDEAWRLSRRASVKLTGLPDMFEGRFGCTQRGDVLPSEVVELFREIREFVSGLGIVYKIKNY